MTGAAPAAPTTGDHQSRSAAADPLRWVGLIAIATIAVMRCAIFFAPQVYFDVDPALAPEAIGGLGPAGSLWLDVLLLLACACALAGEALAGRGLDWWLLGLAAAPWPLVLWHGWTDAGDLWRGVTWGAAAIACASVAHLARQRRARLILLALLAAALGVLLVRSAANVTFEHDATIAQFEAQKTDFLQDKGWSPDSPSARIYERRLRQRQPTGWFLTSNVFASLAASGLMLWLGLALGSWRARLASGWIGAAGLVALAAAGALVMTGSKGALLTAGAALVFLLSHESAPARRWAPAALIALVLLANLGVVLRGRALPEDFIGEKSLLFRWHYTVASARMLTTHPFAGVGPEGYQDAYVRHREPRNPEEVASAHSMFWDWLCSLGLLGGAWIGLVLLLLWRAGSGGGLGAETARAPPAPTGMPSRALILGAMAVAVLGLLPALWVEMHTLDDLGLAVRLLGVLAYVLLALGAGWMAWRCDSPWIAWMLAAGAAALVVHGQIEMTFSQPGAVVWVMCVIGLAGGASARPSTGMGKIIAAIPVLLAIGVTLLGALPATRQARFMRAAAAQLEPIADARHGTHTLQPGEELAQRLLAVDQLVEAHAAWPTNDVALLAAVDQLRRAARVAPATEQIDLLYRAVRVAGDAMRVSDSAPALVMLVALHRELAQRTVDLEHFALAIQMARRLAERDPAGINGWKRLGDVLWAAGQRSEAVTAYERAIHASDSFQLDPLKQLPPLELARITRRIEEVQRGRGER